MKNIIRILITSLIVIALAKFLPGVFVYSFFSAIIVSIVIGLLEIFVKPVLIFFTLPATIFTFGLFIWVINAVVILLASYLMKGYFHVDGFWSALLFSFLLSISQSILYSIVEKK